MTAMSINLIDKLRFSVYYGTYTMFPAPCGNSGVYCTTLDGVVSTVDDASSRIQIASSCQRPKFC